VLGSPSAGCCLATNSQFIIVALERLSTPFNHTGIGDARNKVRRHGGRPSRFNKATRVDVGAKPSCLIFSINAFISTAN
jgi:hypothetical protein